MKARVKAIGEIIEVHPSTHKCFDYDGNNGYCCKKECLILLDDESDYWEKLKHQYAGMAMQGMLSNTSVTERELTTRKGIIEDAERLDTALVEKLKMNNYERTRTD